MSRVRLARIAAVLLATGSLLHVYAGDDPDSDAADPDPAAANAVGNVSTQNSDSVQWKSLFEQSFFFLSVEHGFRVATDPDTRENLGGSFFRNYANSVGNLHGWADGDPFLVNYIGHPIQGAVSGYIWVHNDPRYRMAEFGRNRQYWVGRLRATAFAWAYSEQFEIGPISEASIGYVQSRFPQQGFVDHVITPVVGAGWMIAEDAIDRYVIRRIETRTRNRWVRIAVRGFLNPSRTFANVMELENPWHRDTRPGPIGQPVPIDVRLRAQQGEAAPVENIPPFLKAAPAFEFGLTFTETTLGLGRENVSCVGGGGSGIFNITQSIGIEGDVSGCKMLGLATNLSGDSTTFLVGPRYTYRGLNRWTPWVHALFGGEKNTQELLFPAEKAAVMAAAAPGTSDWVLHDQYTQHYEATGFATEFGGGIDWVLNPAVAFRVGNVNYLHSWTGSGANDPRIHSNDLSVTMGVVLRMGSAPQPHDGI